MLGEGWCSGVGGTVNFSKKEREEPSRERGNKRRNKSICFLSLALSEIVGDSGGNGAELQCCTSWFVV